MNMSIEKSSVSFAVFSYNQEKYIVDAVKSALCQTYQPLEIIISDDHSSDGTYKLILETVKSYTGPHKLIVQQNIKNLGVAGHINMIMSIANGEYIVIAAGDDISECDRVTKLVNSYTDRSINAVCSNACIINDTGKNLGSFSKVPSLYSWERMARDGTSYVFGAAMSWRKSVFTEFGPLPLNVRNEDQIIPFRAALLGSVKVIPDELIKYREHDENLSFRIIMKRGGLNECLKNRRLQINNQINNYEEWLRNVNDKKNQLPEDSAIKAINDINNHISLLKYEGQLLMANLFKRIKCVLSMHNKVKSKQFMIYVLIMISPLIYALAIKNKDVIKKICHRVN